jgi:hypothetical protein
MNALFLEESFYYCAAVWAAYVVSAVFFCFPAADVRARFGEGVAAVFAGVVFLLLAWEF